MSLSMNQAVRDRANRFTLLAFLATAVMLFAAFTAAYLIRRTASDWQQVALPGILWVNTAVLLTSSFTIELARRIASWHWFLVTVLLGLLFVVGQLFAWSQLAGRGVFLPTYPHSSFIYMLTAVHGVHLLGGVVAFFYSMARRASLANCALYWHFVDGVWVYLFLVLSFL